MPNLYDDLEPEDDTWTDPDFVDPLAHTWDPPIEPETAPASRDAIVHTFLDIPHREITEGNWGCGRPENRQLWEANDETYINGVRMILDFDYMMGYLIEAVDRTTGVVSFHAITTYYGGDHHGPEGHDSSMYQPACGTFFERTEEADQVTVSKWAIDQIYSMLEDHAERERRARSSRSEER